MNLIKLLPQHEAQKIAAGEVVERPAHAVKELIENALDAGATTITLRAQQAGKTSLEIIDNGLGMSPQDAKLCVQPHATSKIEKLDDLQTIHSFGFRGEALASISAISKLTITTRRADDNVGTQLTFEKGTCAHTQEVGCPVGTQLLIKDLFYNIPVRKKFLKRDETEWNLITNLIQSFCLQHMHVGFTLYHNDRMVLKAPAVKNLRDRIAQIWDHNTAQNMLDLTLVNEKDVTIHGMISNHHFWRYNRNQIFFFVNNRCVKMSELSKALLKGFRNVLPPAKFPAAFIFITVPADSVDINVHPKKEEVRFTKPVRIARQLQEAVSRTLENQVSDKLGETDLFNASGDVRGPTFVISDSDEPSPKLRPTRRESGHIPITGHSRPDRESQQPARMSQHTPSSSHQPTRPEPGNAPDSRHPGFVSAAKPCAKTYSPGSKKINTLSTLSPEEFEGSSACFPSHHENTMNGNLDGPPTGVEGDRTTLPKASLHKATHSQSKSPTIKTKTPYTFLGQLFSTYLLIQRDNELIMIDQHAAHERILYERWMKRFTKKESILLLFPITLHMVQTDIDLLLTEQEFFSDQGIGLRKTGEKELSIISSPVGVADSNLEEIIRSAIGQMHECEDLEQEVFRKKLNEHVHSHLACKAAIKAGDKLERAQIDQLISDLLTTDNRFICIHGRPTMWVVSKAEIEKKFRRRGG